MNWNQSITPYRKYWLPELIILLFIMVLSVILFRVTQLDILTAKWFYYPENATNNWPQENWGLWKVLYHSAPILTGLLAFPALAIIIFSKQLNFTQWRLHAVYIFFAIALGPGLVVNAIFKDHWGRPRPRQVIELGGKYQHLQLWEKGISAQGKSFPCGHASSGFIFFTLWFILRRKKPWLARGVFAGSIGLGLLLGAGRLAAGGHFFSDTIWAGIMTYFVSYLLYYFVFKIPFREDHPLPKVEKIQNKQKRWLTTLGYSTLTLALLASLLLASPIYKDYLIQPESKEVIGFLVNAEVIVDYGDITVIITDEYQDPFVLKGQFRGFGLPNYEIRDEYNFTKNVSPRLIYYKLWQKGIFTDRENDIHLQISAKEIRKLKIHVEQGDIKIIKSGIVTNPPVLDLSTGKGEIFSEFKPHI